MWVLTADGFFSAVEDRDDHSRVFIRGRARGDAQRLADALGATIMETPSADYRFRVRVSKAAWSSYVAACAGGIDYDNFKNAVATRQGSRAGAVYGEVWGVLLRLHDMRSI